MAKHAETIRKRGRPRRAEPAEATGYRVTEALRRELDIARGFTGHKSNQGLIDDAVRSYLLRLRETKATYRAAAEALDQELQAGGDNIAPLAAARRHRATR